MIDRLEQRLAARKLSNMQDRRAGMIIRLDGPVQLFAALKPPVVDTGKRRRHTRHLIHDLRRVVEIQRIPHAGSHLTENLPIRASDTRTFHSLAHPLNAALGVGEGALFLRKGKTRQNHIGELSGIGHENVLHHEEFHLGKRLTDMVEVRVRGHRVFRHDVNGFNLASVRRVHDLYHGQAGLIGEAFNTPGFLELFLIRRHSLIAGVDVGQTAHIAGALNVVLPAQRTNAATGNAHIAQDGLQVRQRHHVEDAGRVLRDAHGPEHRARFASAHQARRLSNLGCRYTRDLFGLLERVLHHRFLEILEALGARGDIRYIFPTVNQDLAHQAVYQSHIGAGAMLQVQTTGQPREVDAARVSDNQRNTAITHGMTNARPDDGVLLGGVGANDEDNLRLLGRVFDGVAHRTTTKRGRQTRNRRSVTESRAVINVIGLPNTARNLLHQVALFVRAFRRSQVGNTVGTVCVTVMREFLRDEVQRLIPSGLAETRPGTISHTLIADKRRGQAVGARHEIPPVATLDAQRQPVGGSFFS
ncbi:MAG: hypothetical protein BWY63_01415 [Chloroflexi bacterium ADurb.Bin360]|nr:MAG: hypothetical protein BWY63_01415 [Chloroflexi bacterium ADurb.Bin360]